MSVRIQDGEVSVMADKLHILNKIMGASDLDKPLPEPLEHGNFSRVNAMLRGRFAMGTWYRALREAFDKKQLNAFKSGHAAALKTSGLNMLTLDLQCFGKGAPEACSLTIDSLPDGLRRLELG